jgi:hypothetical protein
VSRTPSSGTLTPEHKNTMQPENDTTKPEDSPQQEAGEGCSGAACSASCFVAGIVKGLVESGDPFAHFGSLMAFDVHARDALRCGVVEGDIDDLRVTKYGNDAYRSWGIETYRGRAYMWKQKSFILPNAERTRGANNQ